MNILVTGANGFVGKSLVQRLLEPGRWPDGRTVSTLTLVDLSHDGAQISDDRVVRISGCISDNSTLDRALSHRPDVVFHLAAIASGRAEENFELGMRVNVQGTLGLLERLGQQKNLPRLVFSSSIGVYGTPLPDRISDDTPITPSLSYGAQKRAMELILSDYARRGLISGLALRLPGIVVRPDTANGAWSLFTSRLISSLSRNEAVTLPVSPEATVWLMSLPRCIDNLMQAARMPATALPPSLNAAWNLPCLHVTIQQIVDHFDQLTQGQASQRVRYEPRPDIQAQFGNYPPLISEQALRLGFKPDASLAELVQRSTKSHSIHPTETS